MDDLGFIIFKIFYYILEVYIVFLFIVGTWRLAQSTKEKGTIVNINEYKELEERYMPFEDFNPVRLTDIYSWFFKRKTKPEGVGDLVILKRQFDWGLRLLIIAFVSQYLLHILREYFLVCN